MSGLSGLTAAASALGGQVMDGAHRLATIWISAQPGDPDPSSGKPPEWGKAAPAGILIWLFLGVALVFLVRSMNKHIKRVPASFDDDAAGAGSHTATDAASSDSVDTGGGSAAAASARGESGAQSAVAEADSVTDAAGPAGAHVAADVSTE